MTDPLRPRRFAPWNLLASALLSGVAFGCGSPVLPDAASQAPLPSRNTRNDAELRQKVEALTDEMLGRSRKDLVIGDGLGDNYPAWNASTSVALKREVVGNPPVKYPSIPISCGNSYVGMFDADVARDATHRLFRIYGIDLKKNQPVKGAGYEFVADGYDPKTRVGFKLIMPEGEHWGEARKVYPVQPDREKLDKEEKRALGRAVEKGELSIFVAEATRFPNMDGDLFTPLEYYLASVVDYLNWIHGDKEIQFNRVLGKLPGGNREQSLSWPTLPGCGFERDDDLKHWKFRQVAGRRESRWSSQGESCLFLHFQPGGEATYTIPAGQPVPLDPRYFSFHCAVFCDAALDEEVVVTITLTGVGGKTIGVSKPVKSQESVVIDESSDGVPFKELRRIAVTTNSKNPLHLYIDDFRVRPPLPPEVQAIPQDGQ